MHVVAFFAFAGDPPGGREGHRGSASSSLLAWRYRHGFGSVCLLKTGCQPEASSFTFAELFAGIGGFRVGLESLGGRCVFSSEIEPFTRELYTRNFGDVPAGDIQEVQGVSVPAHDLLVAGFPCQPFSALGDQPGFEDSKGLLFREIVRILRSTRTPMFLLENVPGLAQCDEGKALRAIRDELRRAGYEVGTHF